MSLSQQENRKIFSQLKSQLTTNEYCHWQTLQLAASDMNWLANLFLLFYFNHSGLDMLTKLFQTVTKYNFFSLGLESYLIIILQTLYNKNDIHFAKLLHLIFCRVAPIVLHHLISFDLFCVLDPGTQ